MKVFESVINNNKRLFIMCVLSSGLLSWLPDVNVDLESEKATIFKDN